MAKVALLMVVVMSAWCFVKGAHNVTQVLEGNPEFSTLNTLLTQSGITAQINSRISVTLLAPPNAVLDAAIAQLGSTQITPQAVFFILAFHVLLDYYDMAKLTSTLPDATTLVTTLYQTTGNGIGQEGFLNITQLAPGLIRAGPAIPPNGPLTVALDVDVYAQPPTFSIIKIDGVLIPPGVVGVPTVLVNITQLIAQNGNYSTFLALATELGLLPALESREVAPGGTILLPTNAAFAALPADALTKLTPDQKVKLMLYHIMPGFYSFETLASLIGLPIKTLASSPSANDFTFTVSSLVGSPFVVSTGINTATIGEVIYTRNPLSLVGINAVLLPSEIFGATNPPATPPVVPPYPSTQPSTSPASPPSLP